VVRQVTDADKKVVRRCGGFLFATKAQAEARVESEMLFDENGPPWARGTFAHKRVDGLRIYLRLGVG
jgi:hypothetical protein